MSQSLTVRSPSSVLDDVYDAVLLELAVMHPRLSEDNEMALKVRLLDILEVAQKGECEPAELIFLFRQTMHGVDQQGLTRQSCPQECDRA